MPGFDAAAAARALEQARRTRVWLSGLPDGARPRDDAEAYAVQDLVAAGAGPIMGWKVGAASPDAEPFRAPIHAATLFEGGRMPAAMFHVIGVEAELVYRMGRDLPPRAEPYGRDEVLAAVATLHPAIEVVDTRFKALADADPLSQRADQQNHGALAVGPGLSDWAGVAPLTQPVRLTLDGRTAHEGEGGNSAGDPVRLLAWLANVGAVPLGGLKAGQSVTTGSCSGTIFVQPGVRIDVEFPGVGAISLSID